MSGYCVLYSELHSSVRRHDLSLRYHPTPVPVYASPPCTAPRSVRLNIDDFHTPTARERGYTGARWTRHPSNKRPSALTVTNPRTAANQTRPARPQTHHRSQSHTRLSPHSMACVQKTRLPSGSRTTTGSNSRAALVHAGRVRPVVDVEHFKPHVLLCGTGSRG